MSNEPLVSVIVPVYNRLHYLEKCIDSVLNQTYSNYEIIVVDDGSTEDISNFLKVYSKYIIYYRNQNRGVAYSRNFGIDKANGKYIAFLDSDDFWEKNKLKEQVKIMEEKNGIWSQHSYYNYYELTNKRKIVDTSMYEKNVFKYLFTSFKVQTSCLMIRKNEVKENNIKFDESKDFGEDNAFYIELAKKFTLISINQVLGNFRIHGSNAGKNIKKQIEFRKNILEAYRKDDIFKKNTTYTVKKAYQFCSFIFKKNIQDDFICSFLYLGSWLIFKISAFLIIYYD